MMFSVIVPAYNVEKYLSRCIDTVLHQTFRDYEIIIVDDGATDNTGKISDMLRSQHPDIIKVIHQKNRGLGGARNVGLEEAKGEYLVFIDSDDYVRKDLLEKAYGYLVGEQLDILVFGITPVRGKGIAEEKPDSSLDNFRLIQPKEYLITCGPSACNKICRKSVFISGEIRYPEKLIYEDIVTTPMTALSAKKIGVIDLKLYYYVRRRGSIITSPKISRVFEIQEGFDRVIQYYCEHNAMQDYYDEIELLAIIHLFYFTNIRIILTSGKREDFRRAEGYIADKFPNFRNNPYLFDEALLFENGVEIGLLKLFLNGNYIRARLRYFPLVKVKKIMKNIIFQ